MTLARAHNRDTVPLIYLKPEKPKFAIGDIYQYIVYQNIREKYLIKVTHQTGQRRYSWLMKFCQQNLLLIELLI